MAQEHDEFAAVLSGAREVDDQADQVLTGERSQQVAVEVIDPVEAWAEIPRKLGSLLAIAAPELAQIYTAEACREWGRDMHRLAVKRQWSADGLPPEVAATISTAGLVLPTIAILKSKRDAIQAARRAQQASGESPGMPDPLGDANADK